ncbi:fungal-specific transcription factor [Emericellopsis atlantica]|uniref:Fungal-specific transcription factor n=1 Tax=Emericellopsis atlantica TaxID=2614577 RepID=A0A9P7ZFQ9_9HYPO|nr:fungal-specific transcription factor [Emericellopsis atlantica]KAG9250715.1 fungal-specific transcription factor [Emericellopsis atlantica]
MDPGRPERPANGRRRANGRACTHCHQRKVRCDILDKGAPCTNCRTTGRAGCLMYEKKRLRSSRRPSREIPIRPRETASASLSATATPRDAADSAEENDPGNLAEFIDCEDVRTAMIDHHGRTCFIGTEVSNFNYLVRQSSCQPGYDSVFHFGNRQFARKLTAHDLQHVPPEALERPSKEMEARLLRAYFDNVNTGWPIVDEEHFMAQYEGKVTRCPVPLPLLNAIFVVGSHVLAAHDSSIRALQPTFFRRAKLLVDYRFEQDRTMYVQVALLLTWYSDGLEEIVANAWHWIGIATRTALGAGMHRDVSKSSMMPMAKRTWARLFWVLFQFDTMVSLSYGRPQAMNLEESDVPELTEAEFEGVPNAEVSFVVHHARLCAVIAAATRARWALRATPESRIQAARDADMALAQFTQQLPPSMQLSYSSVDPWQATLHLTYNNFLVLSHRPPPKGQPDPVSEACSDPGICSSATLVMASILETMRQRGALTKLWHYSIHALFTALVHVSSESNASSNPLVSAKAQQTFDSLRASLRGLCPHWRFAQGVLQLFEQRASKHRHQPVGGHHRGEGPGFSLRPGAAEQAAPGSSGVWRDGDPGSWTAANETNVAPVYADVPSGDMFLDDLSLPDETALELFLSGMENSDGFEFTFNGQG